MTYFDNSNMVDDLSPPKPEIPGAESLLGDGKEQAAADAKPGTPAGVGGQPAPQAAPAPKDPTKPEHSEFAPDTLPCGGDVTRSLHEAALSSGQTVDEAKANSEAFTQMFNFHGVDPQHAPHLIGAAQLITSSPPDEQTIKGWHQEARDRLAATYGGPENGARALANAKAYVAKHPDLAAYLNHTGMGNHPRVVAAVADVAHRAKQAGKKF